MAKTTVLVFALFCVSGKKLKTSLGTLSNCRIPAALQASSLTRPVSPESEAAAIQPLPIEIEEAVSVPEVEVLPLPETEACEVEEQAPEVIEVPEIEVIVPEVPEVKPLPIEEDPEVEACAESETAGVVRPLPEIDLPTDLTRPLPVEENAAAVRPEIELPAALLPEVNLILPRA